MKPDLQDSTLSHARPTEARPHQQTGYGLCRRKHEKPAL